MALQSDRYWGRLVTLCSRLEVVIDEPALQEEFAAAPISPHSSWVFRKSLSNPKYQNFLMDTVDENLKGSSNANLSPEVDPDVTMPALSPADVLLDGLDGLIVDSLDSQPV
jgi:hypothetical protein